MDANHEAVLTVVSSWLQCYVMNQSISRRAQKTAAIVAVGLILTLSSRCH